MKLAIVSVRDSASELFGRPIFVQAVGQAMRSFADEVNGDQSDVAKHPDDFELFQLGLFDDSSGQFETSGPQLLARAKDLKR